MTKQSFSDALRQRLQGLPPDDVSRSLEFYGEVIADRMEDGLSEEDAVAAVGTVDEIVAQILRDTPLVRLVKTTVRPRRSLRAWEIVLLVLGSPVWFSLLVAAFAVVVSLYASLWAVIVSLWAVFGSLVGCAFAGAAAGIGVILGEFVLSGVALIGAGIVCAGLSIFMFYGCKAITKGSLVLTKNMIVWLKNGLMKKEGA